MGTFNEAFGKAREKFEKSGNAADYTFEHNGKKYTVLKKGESKRGIMDKYTSSDQAPEKTSTRPKKRMSNSDLAPKSSARPMARGGKPTPAPASKSEKEMVKDMAKEDMTPRERTERVAATRSAEQNKRDLSPDKVTKRPQARPKKEKKLTDYRDDEKARRRDATGTVPSGYRRVDLPMNRGGMVKTGHTARPAMFYDSKSPKGLK